jgi:hypothetical protein
MDRSLHHVRQSPGQSGVNLKKGIEDADAGKSFFPKCP